MNRLLILLLLVLAITNTHSQTLSNSGFELSQNSNKNPSKWILKKDRNHSVELDIVVKNSGKYSLKLEGHTDSLACYGSFFQIILIQDLQDKTIRLHGKVVKSAFNYNGSLIFFLQTVSKEKKVLQMKMDTISSILSNNRTWIDINLDLKILNNNATLI